MHWHWRASAGGNQSIAIGKQAMTGTRKVRNNGRVLSNNEGAEGAVAIGHKAHAKANHSIAIGTEAMSGDYNVSWDPKDLSRAVLRSDKMRRPSQRVNDERVGKTKQHRERPTKMMRGLPSDGMRP